MSDPPTTPPQQRPTAPSSDPIGSDDEDQENINQQQNTDTNQPPATNDDGDNEDQPTDGDATGENTGTDEPNNEDIMAGEDIKEEPPANGNDPPKVDTTKGKIGNAAMGNRMDLPQYSDLKGKGQLTATAFIDTMEEIMTVRMYTDEQAAQAFSWSLKDGPKRWHTLQKYKKPITMGSWHTAKLAFLERFAMKLTLTDHHHRRTETTP